MGAENSLSIIHVRNRCPMRERDGVCKRVGNKVFCFPAEISGRLIEQLVNECVRGRVSETFGDTLGGGTKNKKLNYE